jgi:hypothetical protein
VEIYFDPIAYLLLVFLGMWIRHLRNAITAQQTTIAAQQTLLQNMGLVVDATDVRKMHERFEAYRKLVDNEKDAMQREHDRRLIDQRKKTSQAFIEVNENYSGMFSAYTLFVAEIMPYVPVKRRREVIEDSRLDADTRVILQRLADEAPDLSGVVGLSRALSDSLNVTDQARVMLRPLDPKP